MKEDQEIRAKALELAISTYPQPDGKYVRGMGEVERAEVVLLARHYGQFIERGDYPGILDESRPKKVVRWT